MLVVAFILAPELVVKTHTELKFNWNCLIDKNKNSEDEGMICFSDKKKKVSGLGDAPAKYKKRF